MTIAAYLRVSTTDQDLEIQREQVKRGLMAEGYELADVTWYEDENSGTIDDRKFLNSLLAEAEDFSEIWVANLDRLSRDVYQGVSILAQIQASGVPLKVCSLPLDFTTPVGKLVAAVMFGVAEIELSEKKERQALGIAKAKSKGVYKGRAKGTLKAEASEARELWERGWSKDMIAEKLGVSVRTVWRYLKDGYGKN